MMDCKGIGHLQVPLICLVVLTGCLDISPKQERTILAGATPAPIPQCTIRRFLPNLEPEFFEQRPPLAGDRPSFGLAKTVPEAPTIAEGNRFVRPNESITLTGEDFSLRSSDFGSDTSVYFCSLKSGCGCPEKIEILRHEPEFLQVLTPPQFGAGPALLWVGNARGFSKPFLLNATSAWWVGPGGNAVAPGEIKEIIGRNLTLGEAVQIAWFNRGQWRMLQVVSKSDYTVAFQVPSDAEEGVYKVALHNGLGGLVGWSESLEIEVKNPWTREEFTQTVTSTGGDDAQRIQDAIRSVSRHASGGTVFLPDSHYLLNGPLRVFPGVRLMGTGKEQTTLTVQLERGIFPGATPQFAILIEGAHTQLENLSIVLDEGPVMPSHGILGTTLSTSGHEDVNLIGISWESTEAAAEFGNFNQLTIRRSRINNCTARKRLDIWHSQDLEIRNNLFYGANDVGLLPESRGQTLGFSNASRIYISGNHYETIQWLPTSTTATVAARRMLVADLNRGNGEHFFMYRNTSKNVAPLPEQNCGEMVLFHAKDALWYGQAVSSRGTTLTFRTDGTLSVPTPAPIRGLGGSYTGPLTLDGMRAANPSLSHDIQLRSQVMIVGGRGMGQYRRLVSYGADWAEVDRPWNVEPDSTSRILIGFIFRQNIVAENHMDAFPANVEPRYSANRAIYVWGAAWETLIEKNTSRGTFRGEGISGFVLAPSFWNESRENIWSDIKQAAVEFNYGTHVNSSGPSTPSTLTALGPFLMGNIFRGTKANVVGTRRDSWSPFHYFLISTVHQAYHAQPIESDADLSIGNIAEHLDLSGTRQGIIEGDKAKNLFRNNTINPSASDMTSGVLIRRHGRPLLIDNIIRGPLLYE